MFDKNQIHMSIKFVYVAAIIILSMVFLSCKKEKDIISDPITYPNYSQLKVGNYWIYQQFDFDDFGNMTPTSSYDSCYIEKDTIVNGKTYFKMFRPSYLYTNPISFLRDSLHYLVNLEGKILFSSQDFTSVLNSYFIKATAVDTVCQVDLQMKDKAVNYTSPAGTFVTSNAVETFNMFPDWTGFGNPRFKQTRYAENIGIIMETLPFFFSSNKYVERRLVRYHLN